METNKILDADFLDIIFDGRNKEYGAYQLRRTYNRRLTYSLTVMLGIALLAVAGTVLGKTGDHKKPLLIVQGEVNIASIREEIKPPVVPPAAKEVPKVEIKKFTPPDIVTHDVKEPPPTQDVLDNTQIGPFDQKGDKSVVEMPVVEEKGTGVVAAPKVTEDYEYVRETVQIQAQFPGGPDAWAKYLTRTLRVDVPTDNGASPGNYTVVVSFIVDKQGNISEVKAENDPGFGTADEAVRVIQRGPKWKPAIQNGSNVIYRQKQSITFQVSEQ